MGGPYGTANWCSRFPNSFSVRSRYCVSTPTRHLGKEGEKLFLAKYKSAHSRSAAASRVPVPAFRAVDALVQNINSVIGSAGSNKSYDRDRGEGSVAAEEGRTGEEGATITTTATSSSSSSSLLDTTGYRHIVMRIRMGNRVTIEDTVEDVERFRALHENPSKSVTKSLQTYLGLPLEQYSLLNPKWITRLDGDETGTFLLKIPLNEIVGLQFQPSMKAQVETTSWETDGNETWGGMRDKDNGLGKVIRRPHRRRWRESQQPQNDVTITGKETKMGSHIFDDLVNISFQLNISSSKKPDDVSVSVVDQNSETTALKGQLVLDVEVNVPMPLSKLPKRVLKSAGGTLIRLVMKRMLKGFLVLLVHDFERWCYGESRTTVDTSASKEGDN